MSGPVTHPIKPMLAKAVEWNKLPDTELIYEPKWDGFRCIVFKDGDEIVLGSRNERPLTRYFPEILEPLRQALPERAVIDGELIVAIDDHLEFDALQQRIHPAESRVNMLAEKTPAQFVAFDVLAIGDDSLMDEPFAVRRSRVEELGARFGSFRSGEPCVVLTPTTRDEATAREWFVAFEGAGLDGLIAKPAESLYEPNKRSLFKLKHVRSADVVVAGYRVHKDGNGVGSLLLGLYDDAGNLRHMGVATSFTAKRRAELIDELAPNVIDGADHPWSSWQDAEAHHDAQMPGAPNRWSGQRSSAWTPLDCSRVAEVKYGSTLNGRFRATTKMLRWRPDRDPESCGFDQLHEPEDLAASAIFASE